MVPNLARGNHGFLSEIADDTVLDVALAEPDGYPHAEERRLFYAAHGVKWYLSRSGKEFGFLRTLMEDQVVEVTGGQRLVSAHLLPQVQHRNPRRTARSLRGVLRV